MNNDVDILQIKIEQAKAKLPAETLNAIAAVDWKAAILKLREKKGYSFDQLGSLEIETELLLCGLVTTDEYEEDIIEEMRISKRDADEIVNEMNISVFSKIREEMIKNSERKKLFETKKTNLENESLEKDGIKILPTETQEKEVVSSEKVGEKELAERRDTILNSVENPEKTPILMDKLSKPVQTTITKTEHQFENIAKDINKVSEQSKTTDTNQTGQYKVDPYRMSPDE